MRPAICKHRMLCCCGCIPPRYVGILGTPVHCQCWVALGILLNWMISMLFPIRVRFVGAVPVRVEPIQMIYGVISYHPALQGGLDPYCCFTCSIFNHTHSYSYSVPPGIICACWNEHWCFFLIHPCRFICYIFYFYAWFHESHWSLLLWFFVRYRWLWYCIISWCLFYHGVIILIFKTTFQYLHLYWWASPNNSYE